MDLIKSLKTFDIIDSSETDSDKNNDETSPYDWKPTFWLPYPLPDDFAFSETPYERPKQSPMSFVGVNVIDVENGRIIHNQTVKIKEGLIESIKAASQSDLQEEGYASVKIDGMYMCPGLIDCHVHIGSEQWEDQGIDYSIAWSLRAMLSNGFTTVRDVGGANRFHRQATADWLIPGPRLFVGGPVLSQTGGHGDHTNRDAPPSTVFVEDGNMSGVALLVDGVDACLKSARKLMMAGADHIKICSSGGVLSEYDKITSSQFTIPEIKAVCDTVRMMGGTLVTSHCNTDEGARNGIEGGIGGIEHGGLLSEDTLRLMAKKGIHFTPTLIVQDLIVNGPLRKQVSKYSLSKAKMIAESSYKVLAKAHELGVNIAYGTDAFPTVQLAEFDLRAKVLPGPAILKQATCNAAKVVAMEGKIGCLKVGAYADILLMKGNPLKDISIMNKPNENLLAVIKDGRCVVSKIRDLRVEVPLM